ncbi:radical SAM/SPASM domain-containing protein [Neorhizobium huautlense]|uniref:radical SAM/SPASM domain-containing protein n=1 Tax=Neorhizobium huautlense TaxID=67774 RepID=UPI000CF90E21|nr:radical SAM protein [Neorhizobium huautlense]
MMNHLKLPPHLETSVRLKPMSGYALVYGRHPSQIRIIDPSHAFFLSLCGGTLLSTDIAHVYGHTFGLSEGDAKSQVEQLLSLYRVFLTFESRPPSEKRFDPKKFLYPANPSIVESAALGKWPVPAGVNLNLTFKCNFNCSYCYQNRLQESDQRWNLRKCLELVDEAADWGVVFLGLTGGEPTMFRGWLELLERVLKLGMIPTITSNGTVIGTDPSIARRLAAAGMQEMTISLDASTPRLHDEVTRSHGHFPKVVNAIRFLQAAGIRVIVKSVLTPATQHTIEDLIDFLVEAGVAEIGISHMEKGAIRAAANDAPNVTAEEAVHVRELVRRKREEHAQACVVHLPKDAGKRWQDNEWYPCGGINMGMSVFPSGGVSVCDKMHGVKEFTYGNVFEAGLEAIWHGDAFAALRARTVDEKVVAPECARCQKLHQCRTSCFVDSFAVTSSYYDIHPSCGGPF